MEVVKNRQIGQGQKISDWLNEELKGKLFKDSPKYNIYLSEQGISEFNKRYRNAKI